MYIVARAWVRGRDAVRNIQLVIAAVIVQVTRFGLLLYHIISKHVIEMFRVGTHTASHFKNSFIDKNVFIANIS